MSEYDIEYIQGMFANYPNEDIDLDSIFDSHFKSIDTTEAYYGREVFSIPSKLARYLLHNLSHEVPSERDVKRILRLKTHLEFKGMKDCWPKQPIKINRTSLSIDKGVKRLYAIALMGQCRGGVMMPMELVENELKNEENENV